MGHPLQSLGPTGLSTEEFVAAVARGLDGDLELAPAAEPVLPAENEADDPAMVKALFDLLDTDGSGQIDLGEFSRGVRKLGIQPRKAMDGMLADEAVEKCSV